MIERRRVRDTRGVTRHGEAPRDVDREVASGGLPAEDHLRDDADAEHDQNEGAEEFGEQLAFHGRHCIVTSGSRRTAHMFVLALDQGTTSYRDQIEKELTRRIGYAPGQLSAGRLCASCGTSNDADAKFCKGCGAKVAE